MNARSHLSRDRSDLTSVSMQESIVVASKHRALEIHENVQLLGRLREVRLVLALTNIGDSSVLAWPMSCA
jgi:hypothetical protein